jgi:hypothetical protein
MKLRQSVLIAVAFFGCQGEGDLPDYYSGGQAPAFSGISQEMERGNTGGDIISMTGKHFGEDPAAITVVFGSQNAEILSATDGLLTVRVPQGPIQGGAVNVTIGTTSGQKTVSGAYTYEVGALLQDQAGYILVSDQWRSCLGGVGLGSAGVGCDQIAYTGYTGLEGRAAFLDINFPNVHSMYVGWAGGSDMSWDRWSVQAPGQMPNSFDIENTFKDLKSSQVKGFRLTNDAWDDEDLIEDTHWCADLTHLEKYRYGGELDGDNYTPPFEITGAGSPVDSSLGTSLLENSPAEDGTCLEADGRRLYDRRQMNFCETHEADMVHTQDFQADWPLGETFFGRLANNGSGDPEMDSTKSSKITVDVPGLGLHQSVRLPPPLTIAGVQGFDDPGIGNADFWGLMALKTCDDSDESGGFDLDDAAATFEWRPFLGELTDGGVVRASRTYVRFTLNVLDIGWFGGVGTSIRATITVDDMNDYDEDTELSRVTIPASVLYQFPKINEQWGTESTVGLSSRMNWGSPLETGYGYLVVTADRVTEYTLYTSELDGDVVFAYASGDFGFLGWDNPLIDPDGCSDCLDNDGDGWSDGKDPDCRLGRDEDNSTFGEATCNDGIDNDADGDVDSADSDCSKGSDPESAECGDDIDNDEDGWTDADDPGCNVGDGVFEDSVPLGEYSCNDLEDNDGDGWTDGADPACENATDSEDDGFVDGIECNDGIDNDGNGDVDAEDTHCANNGAAEELEQPEMSVECIDGVDNDGDGYTDSKDPDCEFRPFGFERKMSRDPAVLAGIDECYDGIDNDSDGDVDADDPGCWDADGTPNGFIDDESLAAFEGGDGSDTGSIPEDTGDGSETSEDSGL